MVLFFLVPVFIALVFESRAQEVEQCPALYRRYSATHSFCKPANPSCKILESSVTQEEIEVILKVHNTYRSKIATGKELELPTASNMLQMVWDPELASIAQKHAEQCEFEHDCSDCRRVQNFGVGQNIAIEFVINSPSDPPSNWPSAIKIWYDEVTLFSKDLINPFVAPSANLTYGHFTQMAWASSWRIGCGYVLYKEEDQHNKLYVCNYGEAGNIVDQSMYKEGPPCSGCPENSCCGTTCGETADYDGLCKITDEGGPVYKPEGSYLFYCDFRNQTACESHVTGKNNWRTYNVLSGSYLGIVLNGGEESTMIFSNRIKPTTPIFCFIINYRKGPNVAGTEEDHFAKEYFVIPNDMFVMHEILPDFPGSVQQQFNQYSMSVGWAFETEYSLGFKVLPGIPEQFFEIQSIYATEGRCPPY